MATAVINRLRASSCRRLADEDVSIDFSFPFLSQFTELDHRERQRQRQTERQRQTDRGRDRQRETERGSLAMHFNIREGFLIKQLNKIFERTLPTEVTASNLFWQAVQRRAVVGYYDGT